MPLDIYIFARYFGTSVIAAAAFTHFSDPAYGKIANLSCVGSTGNWTIYSWCPAIVLLSVVIIFWWILYLMLLLREIRHQKQPHL
jgi:zinc transporter 1/2/3